MGEFEELRRHAAAGPRTSKSGSKAPLPKQPVSEADRLRASAISASLLNAQHWFDKGTVALELGHPLDWRTIAGEANSCLMQANRLLDGYERHAPEIVERVEEVTRAMDRYFIRQTPSIASNDAPTYQGVVAKLRKLDLALRWSFDLPYESSSRPHRAATKHDDE